MQIMQKIVTVESMTWNVELKQDLYYLLLLSSGFGNWNYQIKLDNNRSDLLLQTIREQARNSPYC